jgi:hypothetical protein
MTLFIEEPSHPDIKKAPEYRPTKSWDIFLYVVAFINVCPTVMKFPKVPKKPPG